MPWSGVGAASDNGPQRTKTMAEWTITIEDGPEFLDLAIVQDRGLVFVNSIVQMSGDILQIQAFYKTGEPANRKVLINTGVPITHEQLAIVEISVDGGRVHQEKQLVQSSGT